MSCTLYSWILRPHSQTPFSDLHSQTPFLNSILKLHSQTSILRPHSQTPFQTSILRPPFSDSILRVHSQTPFSNSILRPHSQTPFSWGKGSGDTKPQSLGLLMTLKVTNEIVVWCYSNAEMRTKTKTDDVIFNTYQTVYLPCPYAESNTTVFTKP